ncbi:hypothetical protein MIH18_23515 (plasmid) [Marinobacter sp. M3C]|jgi:hypothetical protein|uniref:hypothetical protein n=1 Tax=Marinobacter sp. M3C TaxID=2917715 RepID=UPI0020101560|nr:hypothetical protein [Marinobacter sp. M3C]MCL1485174.1 hypothetical protein [Marinobacter sp.]UQG62801.1 hypothetical protein MIH18_23515 [Marinobacter sp. M3C]
MKDYLLVRGSIVRFLLGEEGEFDRPPGEGPFWWRNVLRNGVVGYHEAETEQLLALESERDALQARVAELVTALQDAVDIIQVDANTEQNYGSLCRMGSVLAKVNADKAGGGV